MRLKCFLMLVFLSLSCGPQSVSSLKIMNGVQGDERFRATLALTSHGRNLCSASLISPYHVLTARHCVALIRDKLAVHVGTDSRNPQESAEINAVYTLPYLDEAPEASIQLNGESWEAYDVALLELKSPIQSVKPYDLIDSAYEWGTTLKEFDPLAKKSVVIAGYGATAQADTPQGLGNTLRYHTEVGIQSLQEGVAKLYAKNTGACSGDSGGSILFPQTGTESFLLGGALSTGNPCAQGISIYNTYALSYPHLCWMKQIINQNSNTLDFASHIRCDEAGALETIEPQVICSELASTPASQTLLDAVAGTVGRTECSQIKQALAQGSDLMLSGHQLRDAGLLQGGRFSKLDLSFNKVEDLSKWTSVSVTNEIDLSHNRISELGGIAHLSSLRTLVFDHNQVKEIPSNQWKSLETLRFWNNQVSQLPDLSASKELRNLKGGRNLIAAVGALPLGLQEVFLEQNQLVDASFAQKLQKIERLFLYQNRLKDFQLEDKSNLMWLTLEKNQITNLVLDKLPRLYRLDFSDNPIETLKLGDLPSLYALSADNAYFSSIPDLSHLTSLEELWLRNNRIEKLEVEKLPPSLKHLELGWNQIKDISPIVALQNLQILSLHGSAIESLDPLLKLPHLKFVAVDDLDNRFAAVRDELKSRGVTVSTTASYGYAEIDFFYLHQNLKSQFPELLNQDVSDEEAVFLVGTTALGQTIKNRNLDLPDSFAKALLSEVFEPIGTRYRLRPEVGQRVFRYAKDVTNYF